MCFPVKWRVLPIYLVVDRVWVVCLISAAPRLRPRERYSSEASSTPCPACMWRNLLGGSDTEDCVPLSFDSRRICINWPGARCTTAYIYLQLKWAAHMWLTCVMCQRVNFIYPMINVSVLCEQLWIITQASFARGCKKVTHSYNMLPISSSVFLGWRRSSEKSDSLSLAQPLELFH